MFNSLPIVTRLYFLISHVILPIGSEVVMPLQKLHNLVRAIAPEYKDCLKLNWQAARVDSCKEDLVPMAKEKTATVQTIGRQELSRRIAKQAKLSQKQASEVLEATLDSIREALQNGDEVRLVGFGSFKVRTSAERKGVNPRDGKEIVVPAKERVRFSPGKELSEAVEKK